MMTDHEAVAQAIFRYARGVDRLDPDLVADAFWPDARISLGSIYNGGRAGFVDVAMGFMGMFTATRHDVANISLTIDGALAGYEAYVRAWHWSADRGQQLEVFGRYIGRAERRDGDWRLLEHSELIDWGEERGVEAGWFTTNTEMEKGSRSRDDASYRWL